jgi:hypothetical protein
MFGFRAKRPESLGDLVRHDSHAVIARKSAMADDPAVQISMQRYRTIPSGLMVTKLCVGRYAGAGTSAIRHHHAGRRTIAVNDKLLPSTAPDCIAGTFKIYDDAAVIALYRARIAAVTDGASDRGSALTQWDSFCVWRGGNAQEQAGHDKYMLSHRTPPVGVLHTQNP